AAACRGRILQELSDLVGAGDPADDVQRSPAGEVVVVARLRRGQIVGLPPLLELGVDHPRRLGDLVGAVHQRGGGGGRGLARRRLGPYGSAQPNRDASQNEQAERQGRGSTRPPTAGTWKDHHSFSSQADGSDGWMFNPLLDMGPQADRTYLRWRVLRVSK